MFDLRGVVMWRIIASSLILIGLSANIAAAADFYWSNGRKLPLKVQASTLGAVRPIGAAKDWRPEGLRGILGPTEATARTAELDRHRVATFRTSGVIDTPEKFAEVVGGIPNTDQPQAPIGLLATLALEGVEPGEEPAMLVTDEFIVGFHKQVSRARIDALNREHKVEIVETDPFVPNQFVLRSIARNPSATLPLAETYYGLPECNRLSHPNFVVFNELRQAPADPLFGEQWHLANTGQGQGSVGADIGVLDAWKTTRGNSSTVIAIIDPHGVEIDHEDLTENRFVNDGESGEYIDAAGKTVRKESDGMDNDNNGFVDDVNGCYVPTRRGLRAPAGYHGTAVAGLAAAKMNRYGGCGVAPECRILAIQVGSPATIQREATAFRYAARMGASVIICSWGRRIGVTETQDEEQAIRDAAVAGRDGKGCLVVFALPNKKIDAFDSRNRDIASHPNVLAVGRSTNQDLWGHCGYGKGMVLLAPSNAARGRVDSDACDSRNLNGTLDIVTTDLSGPKGFNKGGTGHSCSCNPMLDEITDGNYTRCFRGTSAAAPIVGGVAALVFAVNPDLKSTEVRDILLKSADKIDSQDAGYAMPDPIGLNVAYSPTHGYGRVSARNAVQSTPAKGAVNGSPPKTNTDASEDEPGTASTNPREQRLQLPGRNSPQNATVMQNMRALVLHDPESRTTVMSRLGKEFRPADQPWLKEFETQPGLLFVTAPEERWEAAQETIGKLVEAGHVDTIGRAIVIKENDASRVSVLLPQFRFVSDQNQEALTEYGRRHGLTVFKEPGTEAEHAYQILPAATDAKRQDPLKLLPILRDPLWSKGKASFDWITPQELRVNE